MKKKILSIIGHALLVPLLAALVFGAFLFIYARLPIDETNTTPVLVDIPTGTSFVRVTKMLADAGLVENRFLFYSLVAVKRGMRLIRA